QTLISNNGRETRMPFSRQSLSKDIIIIGVISIIAGCGSKKVDSDPLGIGISPQFPDDKQDLAGVPNEFKRPILSSNNTDPFDVSTRFSERPAGKKFTPVRLTSSWGLGVQTTVWALAAGNWLWGYSPAVSSSFGEAPNWFVAGQADGTVTFVNALSNGSGRVPTCMEPYNTGVIHQVCGIGNPKKEQKFKLLSTINGGVLIVNVNTGKCLTTARFPKQYSWALTMESCDTSSGAEVDRTKVWTLTPWPITSEPLIFSTAS
ncbi:TPA: hypothetical protein ACIAQY_004833, partial [Salmonella enterica subsp. diarizonae serovar 61:l,v:z35]